MSFKWIVIVGFFLCTSCTKKSTYPEVELYGHAGMGLTIPSSIYAPNSNESLTMALGFSPLAGVEMDVRMSKDEVLWCFHDEMLETSTNGSGCIESLNSDQIDAVKYTTLHREKIFKLDTMNLDLNRTYLLDMKLFNACENTMVDFYKVDSLLSKLLPSLNFELILSNYAQIDFFSEKYVCYFSSTKEDVDSSLLNNPNIKGFVLRNKEVEADWVQQVKQLGKRVILYDIRSNSGNRSAFSKRPDALITDDIRSAIGYLP